MDGSVRVTLNTATPRLREAARRINNLRTPLSRSETYMERSIGNRFRSGSDWQRLSSTTIKWHPRRAGGKPLEDTGELRMSVTSGAVKRMSDKQLRIGTALPKARLHQFGGRTKLGTFVPARKFLYFDEKDERMVKEIFDDYIEEVARDV